MLAKVEINEMKTCWGITNKIKFCRKSTNGKLFCDQHRRQPIYFIIIAVTGILFSYISGLIPRINLPWETNLYATPESVTLHNGEWAIKTPITVWNRGNNPVLAVWVKIGVIGKGVSAASLVINMPPSNSNFSGRIGNILIFSDTYRFDAIDSSGNQAVFIVIRTMPPNTHCELVVMGGVPVKSHATVKLVSSSTKESTILESAGKVAFSFVPPENMNVKSISLVMKKDK